MVFPYHEVSFPQFVVIYTVKGLSVVNEAEVDAFLEFSCFFCDLTDVGTLISGSSTFSASNLYMDSSTVEAWRILSMTLLACEMSTVVQ